MPLEIYESAALLPQALEIAIATERTVYDSLYLALAIQLNATVLPPANTGPAPRHPLCSLHSPAVPMLVGLQTANGKSGFVRWCVHLVEYNHEANVIY